MRNRSAVLLALACLLLPGRASALESSNPFRELETLERQANRGNAEDLRQLIQSARRLTLHGAARRYARELLELRPDDEPARALLHYRKFANPKTQETVWLDWFDAGLWQSQGLVREPNFGFSRPADRANVERGILVRDERSVSVDEWDRQHADWGRPHEIDSRFFHFRATIPLAAIWFVADDLDALALSYFDYFEIERLPARRYTVHLYRTKEHAESAHALVDLLRKYGAYYSTQERVLHIIYERIGAITAVRHEVAHALNREFAGSNPPQWFDEGVGVTCQFAEPRAEGTFSFGRFPDHGFGTTFVKEVQGGARERMAVVHSTGPIVTNSHYYSKFRSMIDFFMEAEGRKYRMLFIETMFRGRYDPAGLVALPGIDAEWMRYVEELKLSPEWSYRPFPESRAQQIERVLAAGRSSAALSVEKTSNSETRIESCREESLLSPRKAS